MRTHRIAVMLRHAGLAVLLAAAPATAQGWIDPLPGHGDPGVVRVRSSVDVRVMGRVAQVTVEDWFENRGPRLGEGMYVYPLPGEAVFSNFSLYQGDEELRGETMDADRARQIYHEIVRRRKDPALIELVGHGLIRARVFPIAAGESRKITLRYTQVLDRAGDALQLRYAGPREGGGALTGITKLSLTAIGDAFGEPFSPTHQLEVDRDGEELRVRPATDLHGDLSIFLPLAGRNVGISLVTHRAAADDGYFMLTLSPGQADVAITPRDITAVVDVSGSMSGAKLNQTKAALRQLLSSLGPRDRFRLIAFSNYVRANESGWSQATGAEIQAARDWIDELAADGGTNIAGALEEAMRMESPADRLPIVVFLTDGLPTVGERDPERIADAADRQRDRHRVFAFGVGYDVNTYLLDRLSAAGRGSTEYVEPGEDVERVVSLLAGKVTQPVLTDLVLGDAPVELVELYPRELPDLFAGEELVLFGRYRGSGSGAVEIRGRRGGRAETFAADIEFADRAANDFIPRLWAARKLGELTRQVRINGPDPELIEAIRSTALRYGLLSEYTAYLVQEPLEEGALQRLDARAAYAPEPAAATGAAAVKASERVRAQRSVASAADLDMAESEVMNAISGQGLRTVAGRMFRLENETWNELGTSTGDLEVRSIAIYSQAFFDVLEALPELREVVGELQPVVVKGRDVAIRFGEDGDRTLSRREVQGLVERFRAR